MIKRMIFILLLFYLIVFCLGLLRGRCEQVCAGQSCTIVCRDR
jgi:hypothetical protein